MKLQLILLQGTKKETFKVTTATTLFCVIQQWSGYFSCQSVTAAAAAAATAATEHKILKNSLYQLGIV